MFKTKKDTIPNAETEAVARRSSAFQMGEVRQSLDLDFLHKMRASEREERLREEARVRRRKLFRSVAVTAALGVAGVALALALTREPAETPSAEATVSAAARAASPSASVANASVASSPVSSASIASAPATVSAPPTTPGPVGATPGVSAAASATPNEPTKPLATTGPLKSVSTAKPLPSAPVSPPKATTSAEPKATPSPAKEPATTPKSQVYKPKY